MQNLDTKQVLAAFGYDLRQPYDCANLKSRWYGDNLVLLFSSIPTQLDDQTKFALVLASRPQRIWVIPIVSGMLEFARIESDPHNLAAFNSILVRAKSPTSEAEWKSLALSYLALIGHGNVTSEPHVSCNKAECSIEVSESQSSKAMTAWTLSFTSKNQVPRLEDVSREIAVPSK